MALIVFGGHDPSKTQVLDGVGAAILNTCTTFEACQGVPGEIDNPAMDLIVGGLRPPKVI